MVFACIAVCDYFRSSTLGPSILLFLVSPRIQLLPQTKCIEFAMRVICKYMCALA